MDLVWPVSAWVAWVAALVIALKVASRDQPAAAAPAPEAPPPVVELLRGLRPQEVFHSTLFELAGRGWARIEGDRLALAGGDGDRSSPVAGGPAPVAGAVREPLAAYERWVLERVAARMAGAPQAPVIALMPDGTDLDSEFVPLVQRHAIDLGLARRRWPVLVPFALAALLAVPWYATVDYAGASWAGGTATLVAFVAGTSLIMGGRGFLPTARGRELIGPDAAPLHPDQEWIFTGSGWHGVEIEPARRAPKGARREEATGYVVKRWIDVRAGDQGTEHVHYVALHDGRSERATAYRVDRALYRDVLPGDAVRLLVKPRTGAAVRILSHERHW
ncbi:MAG TPA: hypothetical protein VFV66_07260 [Nonomuraea sp.]|nr:hypothetical protein [Nonomuraea sp.]